MESKRRTTRLVDLTEDQAQWLREVLMDIREVPALAQPDVMMAERLLELLREGDLRTAEEKVADGPCHLRCPNRKGECREESLAEESIDRW